MCPSHQPRKELLAQGVDQTYSQANAATPQALAHPGRRRKAQTQPTRARQKAVPKGEMNRVTNFENKAFTLPGALLVRQHTASAFAGVSTTAHFGGFLQGRVGSKLPPTKISLPQWQESGASSLPQKAPFFRSRHPLFGKAFPSSAMQRV